MEIQHLRLQLLSIANGDVDQAKHLEAFLFSGDPRVVSGVEETMGAAIRKLRSGGSMGELPKKECPSIEPVSPRSADAQACTPKGIRVQRQEFASTYKLPDELLKSVDDFLYSLERSLQKQ